MESTHFDVLIIGAGLSGIGAAYHIQTRCPGKTYAILEGRDTIGGTWDLFRYPGIRSDSDMFTFGYSFRPWVSDKAITDGDSILAYIRDTAREFDIEQHIRFNHRVCRANWSSEQARWTIDAEVGAAKTPARFTCNFVYMCTGYYDYDKGHTPTFQGQADFKGEIAHPQQWTADIDYTGKQVIVIGSGATAVTLVPAMAEKAAHVTMLQRSPTYIVSRPSENGIARFFYRRFPDKIAHSLSRWTSILSQMFSFALSRRFPQTVKKNIMQQARDALGEDYDVETHFNPRYNPWDQRVCLVPDGDFFQAMKAGKASIVTDHIDRFTQHGIRLKSGEELDADLIVTATGLRLKLLHGIALSIDDEPIQIGETFTYKGLMISNVPNFALSIGYTNASWTLKSELISQYVCRLINFMDQHGYSTCVPVYDASAAEKGRPVIDFSSGYIRRALDQLPKQGYARPWLTHQNYIKDMLDIRFSRLDDGTMLFR